MPVARSLLELFDVPKAVAMVAAISAQLLVFFSGACLSSTINPESDLIYLGAFRLPNEYSGGTYWAYGGTGMTFDPNGDPEGPSDGFSGSLFCIGHPHRSCVSEFSIPAPAVSVSKDVDELPMAETLQGFADVTEGRQTGPSGIVLCDIQYCPAQGVRPADKLYWVLCSNSVPNATRTSFGWSGTDFSDLQSAGLWRLNGFDFAATSKYLFEIPAEWADEYAPGKYLAAGGNRHVGGGSWGPALYAFSPWNDGNPPGDGGAADAVELLRYGFYNRAADFGSNDRYPDGAWIEAGNKSAVVLAGIKSFRTRAGGREYFGEAQPDGCWNNGYQGEPYYGCMLFYDPFMLAKAARGVLSPDEIQPYARMNVENYMFNRGCRTEILAGVGYDRKNNILYAAEKFVDVHDEKKPVIHVFKVEDQNSEPDSEPPSTPDCLKANAVTSDLVELAWEPSEDNNRVAGYVVFRNGWPVASTAANAYADDKVNPNGLYRYSVLACDARDNRSERSAALIISTPEGPDDRIPIVSEIVHADLSATGVRILWTTDELSDSAVRLENLFDGEIRTVKGDATTRFHEIRLSGLTPLTTYSYSVVSTDEKGNANEFPPREFETSPAGTILNCAPVLNGIGAKRIAAGRTLQFSVGADDLDGEALTYGASAVPPGASFNAGERMFVWKTKPGDEGLYEVTFTVEDGDQTDSETVPIFVLKDDEGRRR